MTGVCFSFHAFAFAPAKNFAEKKTTRPGRIHPRIARIGAKFFLFAKIRVIRG
jgi:hypothetical protein